MTTLSNERPFAPILSSMSNSVCSLSRLRSWRPLVSGAEACCVRPPKIMNDDIRRGSGGGFNRSIHTFKNSSAISMLWPGARCNPLANRSSAMSTLSALRAIPMNALNARTAKLGSIDALHFSPGSARNRSVVSGATPALGACLAIVSSAAATKLMVSKRNGIRSCSISMVSSLRRASTESFIIKMAEARSWIPIFSFPMRIALSATASSPVAASALFAKTFCSHWVAGPGGMLGSNSMACPIASRRDAKSALSIRAISQYRSHAVR